LRTIPSKKSTFRQGGALAVADDVVVQDPHVD
jgi:hypothetical protein